MSATTPEPPAGDDDDLGVTIPDDLAELEALLAGGPAGGDSHGGPAGGDSHGAPAGGQDPAAGTGAPGAGPAADPEEEVGVALLVTQVDGARPLAATCVLAGVSADTVPSPIGALAVLRDTADPAAVTAAAGALSRVLRGVPVLLLDRRAGRIAASRWLDGAHDDDLAAGLVLSGAPQELEDLLLGTVAVADVEGAETSVGMSRFAAMRALAGGRRRRER